MYVHIIYTLYFYNIPPSDLEIDSIIIYVYITLNFIGTKSSFWVYTDKYWWRGEWCSGLSDFNVYTNTG